MQPYIIEAAYELIGFGAYKSMSSKSAKPRAYSRSTPDIVLREIYRRYFKQREAQIRNDLRNNGIEVPTPRTGNVGIAHPDIPGINLPSEIKAFSRVGDAKNLTVDGYVTLRDPSQWRYQPSKVSPGPNGTIDGPGAFN